MVGGAYRLLPSARGLAGRLCSIGKGRGRGEGGKSQGQKVSSKVSRNCSDFSGEDFELYQFHS